VTVAEVAQVEETTLAQLLDDGLFTDGDWVESKDQDPDGEVRLIQLADIGDGVFRNKSSRFLTLAKARELRCTFLEPGDVLIARMPEPLGRACVFPGIGQPAVTAVDVCVLRPNSERAASPWLMQAINSPDFRDAMQAFVRGTTRQRISRKNLGTLKLRVPQVSEQLELASWLEGIEIIRVGAGRHVRSARRTIERFRQAVLAAACSGRLTADWRAERDLVVSSELQSSVDHSDQSVEIPPGWLLATIGDVGAVQLGGTPSRKSAAYWNGGVPWASSGEVANCRITSTRETISEVGLLNSSAKLYPPGTVLIAMIGEGKTRGQAAILDIEASTNQNAAGVLADKRFIDPEFLWRWALAQYEITRDVGRGGNQPALNKQKVRELVIAAPSLAEQAEIVRRVDALLAAVGRIAAQVDSAARRVERSSQAVLARAFRGDLVPTGTRA
jgi:type I restriction enzyme S subunit